MVDEKSQNDCVENDVAIVGKAVNLPGASSLFGYWSNLRDGVESIAKQCSGNDCGFCLG